MAIYQVTKEIGSGKRGFDLGAEVTTTGNTGNTDKKIGNALLRSSKDCKEYKDLDYCQTTALGYSVNLTDLPQPTGWTALKMASSVYNGNLRASTEPYIFTPLRSGIFLCHCDLRIHVEIEDIYLYMLGEPILLSIFKNGANFIPTPAAGAQTWIHDINDPDFYNGWDYFLSVTAPVELNSGDYIDFRHSLPGSASPPVAAATFYAHGWVLNIGTNNEKIYEEA